MGLFKPFWMRKFSEKGKQRIDSISDETLLEKIALNSPVPDYRKLAIQKVNDQSVLAEVISIEKDSDIRILAIYKLTDQKILANTLLTDNYREVKKATVKRIVAIKEQTDLIPEIEAALQNIIISSFEDTGLRSLAVSAADNNPINDILKTKIENLLNENVKNMNMKEIEDLERSFSPLFSLATDNGVIDILLKKELEGVYVPSKVLFAAVRYSNNQELFQALNEKDILRRQKLSHYTDSYPNLYSVTEDRLFELNRYKRDFSH